MKLLFVALLVSLGVSQNVPIIARDFLEGMFEGLHRNGAKDIDHLPDPMKYFDKDEIESFIMAVESLIKHFDISELIPIIQKGTSLFMKAKLALHDIGDIKNSEELGKFIHLIETHQFKKFIPLLMDPVFQQDVVEISLVFKAVEAGDADWKALGKKFGELLNTIITHTVDNFKVKELNDPEDWVMECDKFLEGFFKGITGGKNPLKIPDPTKYVNKEALEAFISSLKKITTDPTNAIFGLLSSGMVLFNSLRQAIREMGDSGVADRLDDFLNKLVTPATMKKLLPALLDPKFLNDAKEVVTAFDAYRQGTADLGVVGLKLGTFLSTLIEIVDA